MKTLGQVAHEAYGEARYRRHGRWSENGSAVWSENGDAIKEAWETAARAVERIVEDRPRIIPAAGLAGPVDLPGSNIGSTSYPGEASKTMLKSRQSLRFYRSALEDCFIVFGTAIIAYTAVCIEYLDITKGY